MFYDMIHIPALPSPQGYQNLGAMARVLAGYPAGTTIQNNKGATKATLNWLTV